MIPTLHTDFRGDTCGFRLLVRQDFNIWYISHNLDWRRIPYTQKRGIGVATDRLHASWWKLFFLLAATIPKPTCSFVHHRETLLLICNYRSQYRHSSNSIVLRGLLPWFANKAQDLGASANTSAFTATLSQQPRDFHHAYVPTYRHDNCSTATP